MAAGLPVLVSHRCGCYEDLVSESVNGFGFDPYDEGRLTDLLATISSDKIDRGQMGQASLEKNRPFSRHPCSEPGW